MNLADYVIHITDNSNNFPDYGRIEHTDSNGVTTVMLTVRQDSLTNIVREQATQIFLLAYTANRINLVKEPWKKDERLAKQEKVIDMCEDHLAMIQLCRKHFHLSSKRIKYWGQLTLDVKNSVRAWNQSDKDRYKDI